MGLNELLATGGKAVIFWTQLIDSKSEMDMLLPDQTKLSAVLKKLEIKYSYKNFSDEEFSYWKEAKHAMHDLESEFIAEGEKEFFDSFSGEIKTISEYCEDQRLARFCYTYEK